MNTGTALQPADNTCLIIYDWNQRTEYSPLTSVLDLVVALTNSDLAHLYRMDPAADELRLHSASSTPEDSRIPRVSLEFTSILQRWTDYTQPRVVIPGDPDYSRFPETLVSEYSSLLAFQLHAESVHDRFAGMLTVCRRTGLPYNDAEIASAGRLCVALVASMKEFDRQQEVAQLREKLRSAREENLLLEKRLAERKLVERAKGLLQTHYGWTEESAYYHLRRTSRQQRTPMAAIAQRIIDVIAAREMERERLSA